MTQEECDVKAPCHFDDCEESQSLMMSCEKVPNIECNLLVFLTVDDFWKVRIWRSTVRAKAKERLVSRETARYSG